MRSDADRGILNGNLQLRAVIVCNVFEKWAQNLDAIFYQRRRNEDDTDQKPEFTQIDPLNPINPRPAVAVCSYFVVLERI